MFLGSYHTREPIWLFTRFIAIFFIELLYGLIIFVWQIEKTLKRFYMKRNNMEENPSIPVLLMCGTTSTIIGQLVSYPLALIRTRLQAQEVPMDSTQKDTMTKLFLNIWQNEGVRGLYRGLIPNIIKVVPAVSISYVVYEKMKKRLCDSKTK